MLMTFVRDGLYEKNLHMGPILLLPMHLHTFQPIKNIRMTASHLHYPMVVFYFSHGNRNRLFAAKSNRQISKNIPKLLLLPVQVIPLHSHILLFFPYSELKTLTFSLSFPHLNAAHNLLQTSPESILNYILFPK